MRSKRALNIFTMIAIVFIILAIVLFPDLGSVKTTGEYIYSSCVLDTFSQECVQEGNSFYSYVDAKSIGVAGHSLGGSAALGVARQRDDIKYE